MWISRVSNSKIGQWCSFTSIFWKKCCYFLHFIGDSLVAVFRLWNWWKGKNVKECFTFHYITTIFSIRTMNATDIWLVPNVKAKLHQNDLDWKKKEKCHSSIMCLPDLLCWVQFSFILLYATIALWFITRNPIGVRYGVGM